MIRAITTAAVAALFATAALSVDQTAVEPSNAATATAGNLRLIHKQEDAFRNYDFTSYHVARNKVDWPINLVFYNAVTNVNIVKDDLNFAFNQTGSTMHGRVSDSGGQFFWDDDNGKKNALCSNPIHLSDAFHFRIYASPADSLFNLKWGFYAIASSHIDHDECWVHKWTGLSENAELAVAKAAALEYGQNAVHIDLHNFYNFEPLRREGSHIWLNDGWATFIRVPGSP
jgi:hypothetical protein